ncbi:hypothetical protein GALMADRAFT_244707 [Galerina marginata CBS 339.88]|uniref:Uncharacterized protein n=1 Tax=Galerina marginata (strain CBS 339.88) TaxID=685588 RepID=A0A067T753_GALM3|nr:hypothetical protein GALMADRAFT_244707 [Galerina marginata CBS 339.88]
MTSRVKSKLVTYIEQLKHFMKQGVMTPDSVLSVYFDARTSFLDPNDNMESSQDIPPPVQTYQLNDNPVPDSNYSFTDENHTDQDNFTPKQYTDQGNFTPKQYTNQANFTPKQYTDQGNFTSKQNNPLVLHPNGSNGWLPAVDDTSANQTPRKTSLTGFHNANLGANVSRRATTGATAGQPTGKPKRSGSLASKRSTHNATGGSAFVNGAGATAHSSADSDDQAVTRRTEADASLTPKQRSKIVKVEAKDSRKLSKIIKEEAKTEKKSLSIAIQELGALQKLQKTAVKNEARVQASYSKIHIAFKKTETAFLEAKKKYETHQAELNAEAYALETLKNNAQEATERLQEKATEVDRLRNTLAVDDREREVRLTELKGRRSGFLWN